MDGDRAKDSDERGITFLPTSGSRASGMMKEKTARITDAMTDLQLGIDGLRTQLPGANDGKRWTRVLAAFGRTCSVFLRKTVLGDFDKRGTRLLDDRVLDSTGLRFDRLRRIPRDKRRWIEVGVGLTSGDLGDHEAGRPYARTRGDLSFPGGIAVGGVCHRVAAAGRGRLDRGAL